MEDSSINSPQAYPAVSVLSQLLEGRNDMTEEFNALKDQLERLVLAQYNREKSCTTALNDLNAQYESIIVNAKEEADRIVLAAKNEAAKIIESAKCEAAKTLEAAQTQASLALKDSEKAVAEANNQVAQAKAAALATTEKATKDATNITTQATLKCQSLLSSAKTESTKIRDAVKKERESWEAEKARVADIQKFDPIIKINIGGNRFDTSRTTLTRFPDTMIGTMFNGRHTLVLDSEGYHFIDRDGTHFRHILNFLRSPETFDVDLPEPAMKELQQECDYYGLKKKMFPFKRIAPFMMSGYLDNAEGEFQVVQARDAVYYINDIPLKYCNGKGCDRAFFPSSEEEEWEEETYVRNFKQTIKSLGGALYQSQPVRKDCYWCRNPYH